MLLILFSFHPSVSLPRPHLGLTCLARPTLPEMAPYLVLAFPCDRHHGSDVECLTLSLSYKWGSRMSIEN
jgi:hypothetical protein